jgi:hypothetical protein
MLVVKPGMSKLQKFLFGLGLILILLIVVLIILIIVSHPWS